MEYLNETGEYLNDTVEYMYVHLVKTYECDHTIATAVRLQLVTWNPIFLDLPLVLSETTY
jgi:hypothetical protein